ncbi:hypothetical protein TVAG_039850 [Trichomonas vaginalis G3]|uniref:WDHD1/CFT4 second beta-propeller domain-containing protein n=1 Tax=Trichomonas vaginalis (strain ATCC PRA-98 / G3) TaxID=412133 RepID=A2EQV9_TRIV3|nr:WD repeat and HMG-box DNA binding protein family [Trichomonas vaginalis G3]EAY04933.1 hypothetical protein TVAG_039850 [Trichomonas vaginalis G3]KAI5508783.1 WD repeat and HMG-box DNA binding protein family [Trichomonas vaginalis G3]|eukprot:XP_001317156.1 hypothetical protein [Trichomonas vaginalis G3]
MSFRELEQPVHFGCVREVLSDPYGNMIITIGQDDGRIQRLNETDLSDAANTNLEKISEDILQSASFCSDHKSIICGGTSKVLYKVDWPEIQTIHNILTLPESITFISCSGKGNNVLVCCQNNQYFVIDHTSGTIIYENTAPSEILWAKMSHDGQYYSIYTQSQKLHVFSLNNNANIFEKEINCPPTSLSWGYPAYLLFSSESESSKFSILDVNHQTEDIITISDMSTPIKFLSLSPRDYITAIDSESNIFIFKRPQTLNNSNQTIKSQFYMKSSITGIKCINWCLSSIIGGNEDGTIFKIEFSELSDIQTPAGEDIEEVVTQDFISDNEDKDKIEEKNENKKEKKNSKIDAFGSLKTSMKDTDTVQKKKMAKSKSHAKQQKLDLVPIQKTIKNPKPLEKSNSDDESHVSSLAPLIEEEYSNQSKGFLSDSDNEKNSENNNEQKVTENTSKPQDFLESESDEENSQKVPPNSENRTVDNSEHVYEPPPPLPSDESDFEQKKNDETKKNYVETLTRQFMPGCVNVDNDDEDRIVCFNSTAVAIQGMKDFAEKSVKLLRPDSIMPFAEIDGHDTINAQFVSIYGQNVIICSSTSYVLRVYSDDGQTILNEAKGNLDFGESAVLVAAGSSFFAIATSLNRFHILDTVGVVLASIELDNRPITMAAFDELLVIVTGSLHKFEIFHVESRKSIAKSLLAGKQPLKWIGFDAETKECFIQSGDNYIFKLTENFGTFWSPVLDLNNELQGNETFYTAYVENGYIYGYIIKEGEKVPNTIPLPSLVTLRTSPITIIPINSPLSCRNPDAAAILERFRDCLVERKYLQAVQVIQLTDDEEVHRRALEFAVMRGENTIINRLEDFINTPKEKPFIFRDKRIKKCELKRLKPPPTNDENEEEEEEKNENQIEKMKEKPKNDKPRESQRSTIFDIQVKKKRIDSDEELLDDLENVPESLKAPKKQTKTKAKSKQTDEQKKTKKTKKSKDDEKQKEEPKKKKRTKKQRLADDSSSSSDEEKEVEEVEKENEKDKAKKKKSTDKPKKKQTKRKLVGSTKPTGISSLASFGFS